MKEAEKKASIKTPLRQEINARRKSYGAASTTLQMSAQKEAMVCAEEEEVAPIEEAATKQQKIKTPLRQAINARRKSYGAPVAADAVAEEEDEAIVAPMMTTKLSLKSPLRQAINARRKSYGAPVAAAAANSPTQNEIIVDSMAQEAGEEVAVAVPETKQQKIKTPLRQEINARRKSYGAASTTLQMSAQKEAMVCAEEEEVAPIEEAATKQQKIKTPLRQAINARRKSYGAPVAAAAVDTIESSSKMNDVVESIVEVKVEPMNSTLLKAINLRRKSYGVSVSENSTSTSKDEQTLCQAITSRMKGFSPFMKSLPTPLRNALHSRRMSATPKRHTPKSKVQKRDAESSQSEKRLDVEVVDCDVQNVDDEPMKVLFQGEETHTSHIDDFAVETSIVATCAQLAVDSFANELEIQVIFTLLDRLSLLRFIITFSPLKYKIYV